jgi:uncharacterized membrane protein YhaH (DUF805 family)
MSRQPTSVLQVLDPRGRCNRKGLLRAAGVLLTAQAAISLTLWSVGIDFTSGLAMVANAAFCWISFALVCKRLHDLGRSSWWIAGAALVWLVAIICLAGAIALMGDPDLLAPETPSYWLTLAAMLLPLLVAALGCIPPAAMKAATTMGRSLPNTASPCRSTPPPSGRGRRSRPAPALPEPCACANAAFLLKSWLLPSGPARSTVLRSQV